MAASASSFVPKRMKANPRDLPVSLFFGIKSCDGEGGGREGGGGGKWRAHFFGGCHAATSSAETHVVHFAVLAEKDLEVRLHRIKCQVVNLDGKEVRNVGGAAACALAARAAAAATAAVTPYAPRANADAASDGVAVAAAAAAAAAVALATVLVRGSRALTLVVVRKGNVVLLLVSHGGRVGVKSGKGPLIRFLREATALGGMFFFFLTNLSYTHRDS
jgi:hypothetical protein